MSGVMAPTYQSGFYAPGRGTPKYPELWRGCVGAWSPSLGQSGLVLRDWSGKGNNGTLTNGPTWGVSGGKQALSFNGTSYVSGVKPEIFSGDLRAAISCWVRMTSYSAYCIASAGNASTLQGMALYVNIMGPGTVSCEFFGNNGARGNTSVVPLNKWTHIAAEKSPGQIATTTKIYINGVLMPLGTSSTNVPNVGTGVFRVASYFSGGNPGDYFIGEVTDIRASVTLPPSHVSILATRLGIAYELAPRKVYSIPAAVGTRQYKLLRPSILRGA